MVFEGFILLQKLLASLLVGYLLGSVPFAHLAARFKGVDIFATGNRRAGTANVFWNVSRRTGVMVFAADVAKGSLAVLIGGLGGIAPSRRSDIARDSMRALVAGSIATFMTGAIAGILL